MCLFLSETNIILLVVFQDLFAIMFAKWTYPSISSENVGDKNKVKLMEEHCPNVGRIIWPIYFSFPEC